MSTVARTLSLLLLTALFAPGCDRADSAPDTGQPRVFVSILPQVFLAERIAGEHVAVEALVGPGDTPHTFVATPRQMARLAKSRVFFAIGVDFEKSVLDKIRAEYPDLRIVDSHAGIERRQMEGGDHGHDHSHDGHDHSHDGHDHSHAGHHHHHGGPDPHVWLDPLLAGQVARNIALTLQELLPEHAAKFAQNLAELEQELDACHQRITAELEPLAGKSLFVFHPAYGYFADRYGLQQVPVEVEGKAPGARQMKQLLDQARAARVRTIFYQPQFDQKNAELIAGELGISAEPLDPLAADYIENLDRMASAIARSWSETP